MPHISRIVVTSGEPAGIGPDLCLLAAAREWPCELVFAASADLLRQRAALLGFSTDIQPYDAASTPAPSRAGALKVLDVPLAVPVEAGRLDTANADYVLWLLDRAVTGCRNGEFAGMVTAPVQKSVINDAGIPFTGHTEYLAGLTGTPLPVMMLVADTLRVALATTHLPLRAVSDALSMDGVLDVIRIMDRDLKRYFGLSRPRILVCGLNPHAGESGHLGHEDLEVIAPAIARAQNEGIAASGPMPADTAFTPRSLADADAVLAMYHDQGLPVLKYAGFGHGVNITLGLPILRTSVDHGTALSLAGTGQADVGSLVAAIDLAISIVTH